MRPEEGAGSGERSMATERKWPSIAKAKKKPPCVKEPARAACKDTAESKRKLKRKAATSAFHRISFTCIVCSKLSRTSSGAV